QRRSARRRDAARRRVMQRDVFHFISYKNTQGANPLAPCVQTWFVI
ncbi:MAG: hypothetical protein RL591_137, partial [Planctomycetota bacterium]